MTRSAIYPGSFNPMHLGHLDIISKALHVFDSINLVQMQNPDKPAPQFPIKKVEQKIKKLFDGRVTVDFYTGFLVTCCAEHKFDAVIRGLRSSSDLDFEAAYQYWNEDLELKIPILYFLADRELRHVSSSTIRQIIALNPTKLPEDYIIKEE